MAWLGLTAISATAVAQTLSPQQEFLFEETNQARAEQRLPPLQWDNALAQAAQAHAEWLAQKGQLSHQYPGEADLTARAAQAGAHFQTIAENIALGPDAKVIQNQWMKSPPHRANILDPDLNAVGFAVVERGGSLYAVADFERSTPNLTADQVEEAVARLLSAHKLQTAGLASNLRQDARQTCEMSHGTAGGSSPMFVMRWQSSDLSQLPSALAERLASHQYQSAAVGACSSANAEQGFTTYRVAVLLY